MKLKYYGPRPTDFLRPDENFYGFLMKKIKPDSFDLILIVIDIFINA